MADFRGHGRTTSVTRDWNTAVIAEDMAGFLDALSVDRAHLIGYSLGGGVAMHLASRHPERVRSLITIGCGAAADIQSRCPQARTWIVPGCGHRPHMPTNHVKEVNEQMLAFLAGIEAVANQ